MQTLHYPLVIIGSGFAGRTVADYFDNDSCLILERGEPLDYGAAIEAVEKALAEGIPYHQARESAYKSKLPWNATPKLSKYNHSRYAFVAGGSSNWWGGNCLRFSSYVFESRELLPWVYSRRDMEPWYALAEKRLNVSGDPVYGEGEPINAMPGAAYWRDAFVPYFKSSHVHNVAINHGKPGPYGQGTCKGRSACTTCYHDAKARPDNIFRPHNILYRSYVTHVEFEGSIARAVEVYDGRDLFRVTFDRLVIAANGIESPRLLARSNLPTAVKREWIGKHYQDHANFALTCRIPKKIAWHHMGGLCHFEIQELRKAYTTFIGGIEVCAVALTHTLTGQDYAAAVDLEKAVGLTSENAAHILVDAARGMFQIYCELEIPPQSGIEVDLESEHPAVLDEPAYPALIPALRDVADQITRTVRDLGVDVLEAKHSYKNGYGGHHFCGTLNMSDSERSVVAPDFRLIGTDNVYCIGSSVIPRTGMSGPTLTIVALAEMLGTQLS